MNGGRDDADRPLRVMKNDPYALTVEEVREIKRLVQAVRMGRVILVLCLIIGGLFAHPVESLREILFGR